MNILLTEAHSVKVGDLLESDDKTWRPVTAINTVPSCPWLWFTLGANGVRMAGMGNLIMVGRE